MEAKEQQREYQRDERGRFTNTKKEMQPRPIAVVPTYPPIDRRGW